MDTTHCVVFGLVLAEICVCARHFSEINVAKTLAGCFGAGFLMRPCLVKPLHLLLVWQSVESLNFVCVKIIGDD